MRIVQTILFIFLLVEVHAQNNMALLLSENDPISCSLSELDQMVALELLSSSEAQVLRHFFEQGAIVLNLYQLQGLLEQDLTALQKILPFLKVQAPPRKEFKRTDILLLYDLTLHSPQLLFAADSFSIQRDTSFFGPAFATQQRLAFTWQNWRAGGQVAKDAGEPIWHSTPIKGFDFATGYLAWNAAAKSNILQKFVLGAYQMQWGQGLQLWSSRGMGKSIDMLQLARNPMGIKPYQGRDEQRYLQGLAASIHLGSQQFSLLASLKRIDAKPPADTLQQEFNLSYTNGLHRSASEIAKRKQGLEQIYGLAYHRRSALWQYGALVLYQNVQLLKGNSDSLPSANTLKAESLWSTGVFAQGTWRQFYFYGESVLALQQVVNLKSSQASNLAFVYYLDQNLEIGLHLRSYGPFYRAFYANPIGNSSKGANERGFIFQIKWQVLKKLQVKISAERLQIPYLLSTTIYPRSSSETRIFMLYQASRLQLFNCQVAIRPISSQVLQYRFSSSVQLQLHQSEALKVVAHWAFVSNVPQTSKHLELSWTHAPLSAKLHFEVIYGYFQIPAGAATLFTNTYLLGIGAQTLQLNGIGTYTMTALKYTFKNKWKLVFATSLSNSYSGFYLRKAHFSLALQKKV
jgi:hypothetical protein